MILSQVKSVLQQLENISFQLPNGEWVPKHFHVTEVGKITKHFIDCGGSIRNEEVISFQLWNTDDYDHRLHPEKLLNIIALSEKILGMEDLEIEVEYQAETIGKFGLDFDGEKFLLTSKQTDCLAKDNCGITEVKPKANFLDLNNEASCPPGSNCC
ncbi:MAG: DUF6428 family protein [Chitinophagales bacterium]